MKFSTIAATTIVICLTQEGFLQADEAKKSAAGWGNLTRRANEIAENQLDPEDIEDRIEEKKDLLADYEEKKALLERHKQHITAVMARSLSEVDTITDAQLRDESLLRIKSVKDVKARTIAATLRAVEQEIARETREIATLERLRRNRQMEALLNGKTFTGRVRYADVIRSQAEAARQAEGEEIRRYRHNRVTRIQGLVGSSMKPKIAGLSEAVLDSGKDR